MNYKPQFISFLSFLMLLFTQIGTAQVTIGSCSVAGATCKATGGYADFNDADANYTTGLQAITGVTNKTITTYSLVNSGATGSIGFDISHDSRLVSTSTACIDNTKRTCVLYPITGCGSNAITPTLGANNATYYNPEFKGLTPNTQYILVVTTQAVVDCIVDKQFITYYSIPATPTSCTTCATATCPVSSITATTAALGQTTIGTTLSTAGDTFTLAPISTTGQTQTVCVPVTVPNGSTVLGFKNNIKTLEVVLYHHI